MPHDLCIVFAVCLFLLQWRHNERGGVSNHRGLDWLLDRLLGCKSKKTLKLCVTGLYERNLPVTGEFPAQRAINAESVSIWWCHHWWVHHIQMACCNNAESPLLSSCTKAPIYRSRFLHWHSGGWQGTTKPLRNQNITITKQSETLYIVCWIYGMCFICCWGNGSSPSV